MSEPFSVSYLARNLRDNKQVLSGNHVRQKHRFDELLYLFGRRTGGTGMRQYVYGIWKFDNRNSHAIPLALDLTMRLHTNRVKARVKRKSK